MNKKKVIIFGVSEGCLHIVYSLDDSKYIIVAYADNDTLKQGKTFINDVKIISPDEINEYQYDYILIATKTEMRSTEIKKQLITQLNVSKEKIIIYYNTFQFFELRIAMLRLCIDEIIEKKLEGSTAELGVYQGGFARYINYYLPDKKLYLFDTFEGFSEKDKNSNDLGSSFDFKEFSDTNINTVLEKMTTPENCIIKKGYFPDTTKDIEEQFCFVSLDADLYKPILSGLEYFYPKLVTGGYIFIHDYNSSRFTGVKKAVREFCNRNHIGYTPLLDYDGSVIITK